MRKGEWDGRPSTSQPFQQCSRNALAREMKAANGHKDANDEQTPSERLSKHFTMMLAEDQFLTPTPKTNPPARHLFLTGNEHTVKNSQMYAFALLAFLHSVNASYRIQFFIDYMKAVMNIAVLKILQTVILSRRHI